MLENADALQEKPDEVHGVLPLDVAGGAKVLFELFELRHHVSVVGLVDEFRKKDVTL